MIEINSGDLIDRPLGQRKSLPISFRVRIQSKLGASYGSDHLRSPGGQFFVVATALLQARVVSKW